MDPANSLSVGRRSRVAVAVAILVALGLAGAFAAGRLTATTGTPATTSAEAGFARDMQVHHNQAVELSLIVRDLTTDADIRLLAYDIGTTQGQQSGQMYGWLAQWRLPQAEAEPSMTWMTREPIGAGGSGDGGSGDGGHDSMGMDMGSGNPHTPGAPMPGLATAAQITTLTTLTGVPAERYFLELMIAHHAGGVEMAEAVLARSTERVVVDLARGIVASQKSELGLMRDMLAQREAD